MIKKSNTINVNYDRVKIHDYNLEDISRNEEIVLICPNCMKYINLGRENDKTTFTFEPDFCFSNCSLDSHSIDEYREHVSNCEPILENGINKIDSDSDPRLFDIVESFSKWCKKETPPWGLQVCAQDFNNDFNEVISYIYTDKIGPVSYITYRMKTICNEKKEPEDIMFIWDLFTFKEFRNKGYAKKLLEHSLSDLDIDRKRLPVSAPYTSQSVGLIKSFSEDKAILHFQNGIFKIVKRDEIDHPSYIRRK